MKYNDIREGVGRITKQNQTVDVGPNEISIQAKKFGNTVDKDGRPANMPKRIKGPKTNVLFNLGITESLDKEKINLLGFSQGASLSIYCGLKIPETFKTVVALCGYVPEDNIRHGIDSSDERDIEIFMGNGTLDQIVTLPIAQASRDYLNSIGISLVYNEYESGHTIPNDCLNDTLQWLNHHNDFDVTRDHNKSQQYDPNTGNYPSINKKPR